MGGGKILVIVIFLYDGLILSIQKTAREASVPPEHDHRLGTSLVACAVLLPGTPTPSLGGRIITFILEIGRLQFQELRLPETYTRDKPLSRSNLGSVRLCVPPSLSLVLGASGPGDRSPGLQCNQLPSLWASCSLLPFGLDSFSLNFSWGALAAMNVSGYRWLCFSTHLAFSGIRSPKESDNRFHTFFIKSLLGVQVSLCHASVHTVPSVYLTNSSPPPIRLILQGSSLREVSPAC